MSCRRPLEVNEIELAAPLSNYFSKTRKEQPVDRRRAVEFDVAQSFAADFGDSQQGRVANRDRADGNPPAVRAEGNATNVGRQIEGGGAVGAMGLGDGNRAVHATSGEAAVLSAESHNFGAA